MVRQQPSGTPATPAVITESLDPQVARLVMTMNQLPGIDTFASCGGHPTPNQGQAATGAFYVEFDVHRDLDGWMAIEQLSWAMDRTDPEHLKLETFISQTEPDSMCFRLTGTSPSDPDLLADALDVWIDS